MGRERPDPPQQLLRPGGGGAGVAAGQRRNNAERTMVYGSSYDENSFQVDGVEVTDNYFNEALAQPNVDAIEEVEVLSLGAPAEYSNLTGAVYNIVTRQGTNEFHGDEGFYVRSDGLTSDNSKDVTNPDGRFMDACPDGEARCPWTRNSYTDFSAPVGGPILKDRLWFFASYANQRDYYWDVGVDSTNPLTAVRNRVDRYFFKLNWQINPKHKLPDLVTLVAPWIEKLTLISFLSWGIVGFARGWIVPGWAHRALQEDRKSWIDRADRITQIAEATLRAKVGA